MNINQKIYLFSGSTLIIIILLIWGVVKPLILEIQDVSALVKERNEKLVVLQKTDQEYLKQLESDYLDVEKNISLIKSGFLDTDHAVDFFIELENIASSTSNELEIEASEFPLFTLYLLGDFPNLMKFLGWLENIKYFLDIDSVKTTQFTERDLFSKEAEVPAGKIKTVLKIRSYIQNPKLYEEEQILKSN